MDSRSTVSLIHGSGGGGAYFPYSYFGLDPGTYPLPTPGHAYIVLIGKNISNKHEVFKEAMLGKIKSWD